MVGGGVILYNGAASPCCPPPLPCSPQWMDGHRRQGRGTGRAHGDGGYAKAAMATVCDPLVQSWGTTPTALPDGQQSGPVLPLLPSIHGEGGRELMTRAMMFF